MLQASLFAAIGCAALAGSVAAAGACNGSHVLHCQVKGNKVLDVCISDGMASYAFGPASAPELVLRLPLEQVQATPWPGVGRAIWEEIVFTNGDVRYAVYASVDRMIEGSPASGGVVVWKGQQQLVAVECIDGTVSAPAFGVSDGFQAAGWCWNMEVQQWTQHCSK